jgi:hypothetical protein
MRSPLSVTFYLAVLGASLSSCHNSAAVAGSVILPAVKLEAPSTITPTAMLTVNVTLSPGSCTSFDRIDIRRTASEIRLTAWGVFHGALPCVPPQPLLETVQLGPPFPASFMVTVVQPQGAGADLSAAVRVQ